MADITHAAEHNDLDGLRRLIDLQKATDPEYDANRMPYTKGMQLASVAAARRNHPVAVGLLLDSGCWINVELVEAALSGHYKDVFDSLIARGWNVSSNLGHSGDALLIAIGRNNQEMVQYLLSRGADPNANTTIGTYRALESAAYGASIPILEGLLDAGAELRGRRALPKAAGEGRIDAARTWCGL
ncbi:hypothetical protein K491DRAFT_750840 [Lophiostoma macrostomum CBS 122681]|uniref:Uncharacterized protein n=1 Tax=Lophiostoma macrostomum CBS 122681 TaxID=1314788 RepID=A0A6A6TR02_9PLEO|nr:hypothetical protein K491DRAFT_750840 [Lophiostoma macrostomum CBS 122681]